MANSTRGRIWITGSPTRQIEASEQLPGVNKCYYRGCSPQGLPVEDAQLVNVDQLLVDTTLTSLMNGIQADLADGLSILYCSCVPIAVDQVALRIQSEFTDHVEKVNSGDQPLPVLPAELCEGNKAGLVLLDGLALNGGFYPPFSPAQTVMIYSPADAGDINAVIVMLRHVYPADHPCFGKTDLTGDSEWIRLSLQDLQLSGFSLLAIPPRSVDSSLESFAEVIAHLRAPNGCPWDRKQTHESLRTYLLEETYEALSALDENDLEGVKEELGDILLQILLHAEIGTEAGEFDLSDVLEGINRKIVYRHPHVFGEVQVDGVKGVVQNWERLKEKEREENGNHEVKGILDGVPPAYPALAQAQAIQDRAARVGFDWPDIAPVRAKVMEELEEVETAPDAAHRAKELGDLLFAVVNLVRWFKVDAESALRETNLKFRRRFAYIEQKARENGKAMLEMTLDEMDVFWEEAKRYDR